MDLKLHNVFQIGSFEFTAYVKVFNLLDAEIVSDVFTDTGQADFTTEAQSLIGTDDPNRPNSVEDYLVRPWHYEPPRRVQVGIDFSF